jgi:hypothetical protein
VESDSARLDGGRGRAKLYRKTTRKLEQRSEKIEEALRKQADDNPRLAEILRSLGLM